MTAAAVFVLPFYLFLLPSSKLSGFDSSFFCLWDVEIHFVAIEISVVGFADTFIEPKGSVGSNFDTMGEDTEFMQRWLSIE